MHDVIDDFVAMNKAGLVLELCEKYYDENVTMLNNGQVFAKSMREGKRCNSVYRARLLCFL